MNLKGIGVDHVVGVSVSEFDLHNKLEYGQVVEVHMDNGEIVNLTRTARTVSHHGSAGPDSMATSGLLLSSDTRCFPSVFGWVVNTMLRLGRPLFVGDVDNKGSVTAIILLPER